MSDFAEIEDPANLYYKTGVAWAAGIWTKNLGTSLGYDSGFIGSKYIASVCDDQSVRVKFQTTGLSGERRFGFVSLVDLANLLNMGETYLAFAVGINLGGPPPTYGIYEDGVLVHSAGATMGDDDEFRIQIINDSGFKVKYWHRASEVSPETLVYTSAKTEAQILAKFPLGVKGVFMRNGTTFRVPSIEITDTETLTSLPTQFGDTNSKNAYGLPYEDKILWAFGNAGPEFEQSEAVPALTHGQDFPSGSAGMEE
jgi:hypothetical protein